jgi:hypothetical protein
MKIPNYQVAIIQEAKITDYLLSLAHPVGRFKARFWNEVRFYIQPP